MPRGEQAPAPSADGKIAIGSAIRAVRWARGLSISETARRLGISRSHLSHIETGSQEASEALLADIAAVLEADIADLRQPAAELFESWLLTASDRRLEERAAGKNAPYAPAASGLAPRHPSAARPVEVFHAPAKVRSSEWDERSWEDTIELIMDRHELPRPSKEEIWRVLSAVADALALEQRKRLRGDAP
jgi:transcriptional regulator with XRE-family HTH domain